MQIEGRQQSTDKIETLRLILEAKEQRPVSYDEALEVGESLISYFKLLASPSKTEE